MHALTSIVYVPIGSKYVIARVNSGLLPNWEYFLTTLNKIAETPIPWRQIAALEDDIAAIDLHGDDLFLLTYRNTPRFKVIHVNLDRPDLSKADTVFPATEAVVSNIGTAADALYVQTLDGGVGKLRRVEYKGGAPKPIRLPYDGTASIGWTDQQREGLLFFDTERH
jgi:prolyl oligopeptidase